MEEVEAPLEQVARHLPAAPGGVAARQVVDRPGPELDRHETGGEAGALQVRLFVPPGIGAAVAAARRPLPLDFGRQASAGPGRVGRGFIEGHAGDRLAGGVEPPVLPIGRTLDAVRGEPFERLGQPQLRPPVAAVLQEPCVIPVRDHAAVDGEGRHLHLDRGTLAGMVASDPGSAARHLDAPVPLAHRPLPRKSCAPAVVIPPKKTIGGLPKPWSRTRPWICRALSVVMQASVPPAAHTAAASALLRARTTSQGSISTSGAGDGCEAIRQCPGMGAVAGRGQLRRGGELHLVEQHRLLDEEGIGVGVLEEHLLLAVEDGAGPEEPQDAVLRPGFEPGRDDRVLGGRAQDELALVLDADAAQPARAGLGDVGPLRPEGEAAHLPHRFGDQHLRDLVRVLRQVRDRREDRQDGGVDGLVKPDLSCVHQTLQERIRWQASSRRPASTAKQKRRSRSPVRPR